MYIIVAACISVLSKTEKGQALLSLEASKPSGGGGGGGG